MKNEETEILVVGAGPAGLIAAREAARKGADVTVIEEDAEIGLPCHCAGLLSLAGLEKIGVPSDGSFVQNKVRGARFFSPSGLSFTVERDEAVACVVDRSLFDKFLAQQAKEAGAEIRLNQQIRNVKTTEAGITALGEKGSAEARIMIDAEGVSSRIVRDVGLKPLNPAGILTGVQLELDHVDVDRNHIEVHTGRKLAPGYFAWVIPLGEDCARVGLACKGANLKDSLERFIEARFGNSNVLERAAVRSGLIVTSGPIEKTFEDNLLVVGDAAGQVKPTTGGGVILGGVCALVAGEVAVEAVKLREFTAAFLRRYESLWKRKLGEEFKTTLLARRIMNSLSDEAIDKLFKLVIKENLQNLLSAEGDMDFQRSLILKLLRKKEVAGILPSLFRDFVSFQRKAP